MEKMGLIISISRIIFLTSELVKIQIKQPSEWVNGCQKL